MVGVAQLVERRIVIPVVVGSIPIVHPIFILKAPRSNDQAPFFCLLFEVVRHLAGAAFA